uniref:Glucuronosyltransferase n=1 Tax=Rhabditophanes sp. KR3021 TaxID=114890 RepID=A0AC35TGY5_9BILA
MNGLYLFFILVQLVSCARILVYLPEVSRSHMRHMSKLSDILVKAGNDVTVLVSNVDPTERNNHGIKLAKIIRAEEKESISGPTTAQRDEYMKRIWVANMETPIALYFMAKFTGTWVNHCKRIMDDDQLTAKIKGQTFDIAIAEGFDSCIFGLYKQYGIKNHIVVSSGLFFSPHYQLLGLTYPTTQVPELFADFGGEGISLYNRAKNLYYGFMGYWFLTRPMNLEQDLFDSKYGKGVVNIKKTFSECAYYITNGDPLLDFAKPITSKVIEIGGFSIPKTKPLDEYHDKIMALRTKNILISFGSNAKSFMMPESYKQNIIKVIKSFPDVTFIWKYEIENDGIADGIDNLVTGKWLPQTDILGDPRLTGFVTHGGLNSLTEASQFGLPLLLVGLFGDQMRNTQVVEKIGFGKGIEKHLLSDYDQLRNSINEVFFTSNKYKKAAVALMESIKNKPYNSTEVFVKYVQYAAKYGPQKMFNILGQDQSFIERNNLDLCAIVIASMFILGVLISKSVRYCCCSKKDIVKKSKKTN